MGIFDFLKRMSKEEKKEVKKIKLDETEKLINTFYEKIAKNSNLSLKEIKERLEQEKDSIENNIRILEEAEFKNKAFPESAIPMMRDNRRTYIQRLRMILKEIDLPAQIDETPERCIHLEHSLDAFGKNTIRNHQILQQYFGEKVSSLAKNIIQIHKLIKEAEKLADNPEIAKANELKNKFKEIQEEIKQKESLKEKLSLEREEQQKIIERIIEKEKKIKEAEEGARYRKLSEIIEKKKDAEKEIRELEKEPLHSFSAINDALKKYERMSLENKLIKEYLENPLKALENDKELNIVDVVHKMKGILMKDGIDLKEEKKKKTIHECGKITKSYLESFLRRLNELKRKINEFDSEIKNETIIKEIEELKEELRKEKVKESENKKTIEKSTSDLNRIDIDGLKKELELKMNDIDENVKII